MESGNIVYALGDKKGEIIKTQEVGLKGAHNLENLCAASASALVMGIGLENISSIAKSFTGLEHRLEFVRTIDEISFYNDSFSTTPETSKTRLMSVRF